MRGCTIKVEMSNDNGQYTGKDIQNYPSCQHIAQLSGKKAQGFSRDCPQEILLENIRAFSHTSRGAIGVFEAFDHQTCPLRLKVNVYRSGCAFKCSFCYVWRGRQVRPDRGVLRHLDHDIRVAQSLGLSRLPVMVSCSTDPFQPWEDRVKHTEKVLERLAGKGFPLIILTRNPSGLLIGSYIESLKATLSVVEISIASPHVSRHANGIFHSLAPSASERFGAMEHIASSGIAVRLRLDPIVPLLDESGPGQTGEDIRFLVRHAVDAGASMVISKTLVLTPEMVSSVIDRLRDYYEVNCIIKNTSVLVLNRDLQKRLLAPVWQACQEHKVPFCSCTSPITFPDEVNCRFPQIGKQLHDILKSEKENYGF